MAASRLYHPGPVKDYTTSPEEIEGHITMCLQESDEIWTPLTAIVAYCRATLSVSGGVSARLRLMIEEGHAELLLIDGIKHYRLVPLLAEDSDLPKLEGTQEEQIKQFLIDRMSARPAMWHVLGDLSETVDDTFDTVGAASPALEELLAAQLIEQNCTDGFYAYRMKQAVIDKVVCWTARRDLRLEAQRAFSPMSNERACCLLIVNHIRCMSVETREVPVLDILSMCRNDKALAARTVDYLSRTDVGILVAKDESSADSLTDPLSVVWLVGPAFSVPTKTGG